MKKNTKNNVMTLIALIVFIGFLWASNRIFDPYSMRIFNLAGIYVTLGLGLNLINGFTGLFSLGHAGFMAVGAYTSALLTMDPQLKQMNFFLKPIVPFLADVQWPFLPALIMAGVMAALAGALIGAPVLRLNDDYLAIATLGFGEIIRVIFTNTQSLTNGALGLKGLPAFTNVYWSWGTAVFMVAFMVLLVKGSYGRAFKAIRENEIAAEAMGVNLFKHKMMSFVIGSFMAGVGGALLGHLMGTIDPLMFRFLMTFKIVLIVVLGGIGSITGTVISAVVVTVMLEALRVLDGAMDFGFVQIEGVPGMRMVVFSALLMMVILFYQRGLMGTNEFRWEWVTNPKKTIATAWKNRKA